MGEMTLFLPLIVIMGAFMFFASRRQKKAMQATIDLHASLTAGDRVMTTTGLYGTLAEVTDDTVDIEIAPGVVTTWSKMAIRERVVPDVEDEPEEPGTQFGGHQLGGAERSAELGVDPDRLAKD